MEKSIQKCQCGCFVFHDGKCADCGGISPHLTEEYSMNEIPPLENPEPTPQRKSENEPELWQQIFDLNQQSYHGGDQMEDEVMKAKAIASLLLQQHPPITGYTALEVLEATIDSERSTETIVKAMERYRSQPFNPWVKIDNVMDVPAGVLIMLATDKWITTGVRRHMYFEADDQANSRIKPTHYQLLPELPKD